MAQSLEDQLDTITQLSPLVVRILDGTAATPSASNEFLPVDSDLPLNDLRRRLVTFFPTVLNALERVRSFLAGLEREKESRGEIYPREIELDTQVAEYDPVIDRYQKIEASLAQLSTIHRYMRLSQTERDHLISRFVSGESNNVLVRTISHRVAAYETLESIAYDYNVSDWRMIAEYNDLLPSDLEEGMDIEVPVLVSPSEAALVNANLPIFGTMRSVEAFGADLPNDLDVGEVGATSVNAPSTGSDLSVLDPIETLKQGLGNIVATSPGEHPASRSFGFDGVVNDDIPTVIRRQWFTAKAEQALMQDPRVEAVQVNDVESNNEGVTLDILVLPKNNNPVRIAR